MNPSINGKKLTKTIVDQNLGLKLDIYLSRLSLFGFDGAMFASKKNKIILNKGYGFANIEKRIPNSPEIFYLIGSISKHFTSVAILQLEMQKKLAVTESIAKYLPNAPEDKREITLHHLLTHTSGLPDMHSEGGDFVEMSIDEAIEIILSMELLWEPKNQFAYSNAGYVLLAAIVEKVSKIPFVDYVKENLFLKAGMTKSCFFRDSMLTEKNVAHGYNDEEDGGSPISYYGPTWALLGAGGIVSTLGDMFMWIQALKSNILLSEEAKKKLLTPYVNEYGYGLDVIETPQKTTLIEHNGGNLLGFSANMQWWPEEDIVMMIFFNRSFNFSPMTDIIGNKVSMPLFSDDFNYPPEVATFDSKTADQYIGDYQLDSKNQFKITSKNNRLYISAKGTQAFQYLTNPIDVDPKENETLDKKTELIMDSVFNGDFSLLEKNLQNKDRIDRYKQLMTQDLVMFEKEFGKKSGFTVVGTIPYLFQDKPMKLTYLSIQFDQRPLRLGFLWSEGKILGLSAGSMSASFDTPMMPVNENDFRAYHLRFEQIIKIRFSRNANDKVIGLEIYSEEVSVPAKKL